MPIRRYIMYLPTGNPVETNDRVFYLLAKKMNKKILDAEGGISIPREMQRGCFRKKFF